MANLRHQLDKIFQIQFSRFKSVVHDGAVVVLHVAGIHQVARPAAGVICPFRQGIVGTLLGDGGLVSTNPLVFKELSCAIKLR